MSDESEASSSISPLSPEHRAVCLGISRRGELGGGGANLLLAKSWINYKHLRGVSPMFADVAAAACRKEESGSSSLPSVDGFEIKLLIAAQIFPRWTACL